MCMSLRPGGVPAVDFDRRARATPVDTRLSRVLNAGPEQATRVHPPAAADAHLANCLRALGVTTGADGIAKKRTHCKRSAPLKRLNIKSVGYEKLVSNIRKRVASPSAIIQIQDVCLERFGQYKADPQSLWAQNAPSGNEDRRQETRLEEMRRKTDLLNAAVKAASWPFEPQLMTCNEGVVDAPLLSIDAAKDLAAQYFAVKKALPSRLAAAKEELTVQRGEVWTYLDGVEFHKEVAKGIQTRNVAKEALSALWRVWPDDGTLRRAIVRVFLRKVEEGHHDPIAAPAHMDDVIPRSSANVGTTYGIAPADRHIQFISTSFCADLHEDAVTLRGCGTVVYDGVPVVPPERLIAVSNELKSTGTFDACTERELIATLSGVLVHATIAELETYSDEDLRSIGIATRSMDSRAWSFENSLIFHRSPSPEEVLETVTRDESGKARDSVRVFLAAYIVDADAEAADQVCTVHSNCPKPTKIAHVCTPTRVYSHAGFAAHLQRGLAKGVSTQAVGESLDGCQGRVRESTHHAHHDRADFALTVEVGVHNGPRVRCPFHPPPEFWILS